MFKKVKYKIEGIVPLLLNNGAKADPLNPRVRELKALTSKKKKTEEDLIEIQRLEFLLGLYVEKGRVVIPGVNLEGAFVSGAKKERRGEDARSAIIVPGFFPLIYDGPKPPEDLWKAGTFRDVRGVVVDNKRIFRCRPRFDVWSLEFTIELTPGGVDADVATNWLKVCGEQVGIGDFTPRFGRFEIKSAAVLKNAA